MNNIESILAPTITALGLELVYCGFVSEAGRRTLRVYIDSPQGVTVEDCIKVNRQVNAILNVELGTEETFDLEVSSPGLDRPLITLHHFQRFVGSEVKIKLYNTLENRRNFVGKLLKTQNDCVEVLVEGQTVAFDFKNIEKANIVPNFEKRS